MVQIPLHLCMDYEELHIPFSGAIGITADPFGEGDAPRLVTNVNCSGSESTLLECGRTDFVGVTCPTAGVVCQGSHRVFSRVCSW